MLTEGEVSMVNATHRAQVMFNHRTRCAHFLTAFEAARSLAAIAAAGSPDAMKPPPLQQVAATTPATTVKQQPGMNRRCHVTNSRTHASRPQF